MTKYSRQSLRQAADRAISNSRDLFGDAETLAEKGRYGPAVSLMILAREEAQKAILFSYCAGGVYDTADPLIGQEIKRALENHEYKHDSAWLVNILGSYILLEIGKSSQTMRRLLLKK